MGGAHWPGLRATAVAEDDEVLALNKPVGISVMGERHETDIARLAAEAGERLFPVHRIDKVTSGAVLFAKNLRIHGYLTRQFHRQTVDKRYLVITPAVGLPERGVIDLPLTSGRKGTVRIAAPREQIRYEEREQRWWVAPEDLLAKRSYPSVTRFVTLWSDDEYALVAARPITGRRHQLRVHFAWIGHQILGDPLFDKAAQASGARTCLHSWRLGFDTTWRQEGRWQIEAPPADDFWEPLRSRLPAGSRAEILAGARSDPFLRAAPVSPPHRTP